ncbi:palmitoleoyl-protein carboxylesterase notum1'-like [Diadema antillarum]|uniref:palmitoleoyl-protein carboxylesterase notum1'-like n=1 Tax=Diadema antillarum TaxID=105358 RepID=UPI003A8ABE4B
MLWGTSTKAVHMFLPVLLCLLRLADGGTGRSTTEGDTGINQEPEDRLAAHTQTVVRGPVPGVGGRMGQFQAGSDENEYVLDLTRPSGDSNDLMKHIKELALALNTCGFDGHMQQLRLHNLTNRSITCNDGSQAGFYLRKSIGSKKWLVFLQGGAYCSDNDSCRHRYTSDSKFMSSRDWPPTKTGTGILSADPGENPVWWRSNVVYIPYCSSDVWSGTTPPSESGGYSFMGALILQQVIRDLLSEGLMDAKQLVLAGSSAGATGVLLNLDRISILMAEAGSSARVVGLADSGWFLETEPLGDSAPDCSPGLYCNPARSLREGTKLWNSVVPDRCLAAHRDAWKCFYGFRIHQTLKTPVYIFQWLYDEVQLRVNMQGPLGELRHWQYLQRIGRKMRASLRNATAVFAPACYGHMVLQRSDWSSIRVRNVKFSKSLQCWLKSHEPLKEPTNQGVTNAPSPVLGDSELGASQTTRQSGDVETAEETSDDVTRITTTEATTTTSRRRPQKKRRRNRGKGRRDSIRATTVPQRLIEDEVPVTSTESSSTSTNRRGRRERKGKRTERAAGRDGERPVGGVAAAQRAVENQRGLGKNCVRRRIDHATCPHCNPTCPKKNPFTGEDMELLAFMRLIVGVDIGVLAAQLGIDERTLALVDPNEGLRLLASGKKSRRKRLYP